MSMTATEIGTAIAGKPDVAECQRLQRELQQRTSWVSARLDAITPSGRPEIVPDPPARQEALLKGTEALLELNRELEQLRVENDQLERLGLLLHEAEERALTAEARRAIPAAIKRLPKLIQRVHDAQASYDDALAELQAALTVCNDFDRLPNRAMPYDDAMLENILKIREAAWTARMLHVTHSVHALDDRDRYPKSWPYLWVRRGDTVRQRLPPKREEWEDWSNSVPGSLRDSRARIGAR